MKKDSAYSTLNHVHIPIVVLNSEHRIIYKNDMAKRTLPHPRTGASVRDLLTFEKNEQTEFAYLVRFSTNSLYKNALAFKHPQNNETEIWLLFLPLLQIGNFNKNSPQTEQDILLCSKEIFEWLLLYHSHASNKESFPMVRPEKILTKTIGILSATIKSESDSSHIYNLNNYLHMLRMHINNLFSKIGYKVTFDFSDLEPYTLLPINIHAIVLALLHQILFAVEYSQNSGVTIKISSDGITARCNITFHHSLPRLFAENSEDFEKLAHYYPEQAFDLLLSHKICCDTMFVQVIL